MGKRLSIGIVLACLASTVLAAEGRGPAGLVVSRAQEGTVKAVKAGTDCAGGWQLDDGTFERSLGFSGDVANVKVAMSHEIPGPTRIDAVCVCLQQDGPSPAMTFDGLVDIWSADSDGYPDQSLKRVRTTFADVPRTPTFYRVEIPGGVVARGATTALGLTWPDSPAASSLRICEDSNGPGGGTGTFWTPDNGTWLNINDELSSYKAFGLRADVTPLSPDPSPPAGPWLSSPTLPGYDFKVRINGGAAGTQVTDCVPETVCIAGAIPTRTELFLRVIGPRPNGFSWVEGVRFTTSRLEIWARLHSEIFPESDLIRYYDLPALPADTDELPGLVDKTAFPRIR